MARNWQETGITWESSPVKRQHGRNASDRRVLGKGQMPVIEAANLAAFVGHVPNGAEIVAGGINGTSFRVSAQDVCRNWIEGHNGSDDDIEGMREAVYNRLLGVRSPTRSSVVTVKVYPLPNGDVYSGTDETEYRAQFAAALVDNGMDSAQALALASMMNL